MSFILDALKKSERARQKQVGPSLFEVKVAAPRRALPGWSVIVGVLLAINAAVVGWVVLERSDRGAAPVPTPAAANAAQPGAASGPASTPVPAHAVGRPGGVPAGPATALDGPSPGRQAVTVSSAAEQLQVRSAEPAAAGSGGFGKTPAMASDSAGYAPAVEPVAGARPGANLPLYKQLESAPGYALPRLRLDLHVYAADPSKRFVMINMHRLKQGNSLPDGVQVISIRPDGVVLSYEGRRFLLPR